MSRRRSGGWLLAGGIVGLALSPGARRMGMDIRARATRLGRGLGGDPVAPFREAPCYEHDRTAAGGPTRTGAAR